MTRLHAANRYDRLTHDLGRSRGGPQQVSVNLLLLTLSHSSLGTQLPRFVTTTAASSGDRLRVLNEAVRASTSANTVCFFLAMQKKGLLCQRLRGEATASAMCVKRHGRPSKKQWLQRSSHWVSRRAVPQLRRRSTPAAHRPGAPLSLRANRGAQDRPRVQSPRMRLAELSWMRN